MKYTYDCKINGSKAAPIINNRSGDVQITDPASREILLGLAPSTVSAAAAAVSALASLCCVVLLFRCGGRVLSR